MNKVQATIRSLVSIAGVSALALCTACEYDMPSEAQGDAFTQVEESYIMESDEWGTRSADFSVWLGSWEIPADQDCALIRVIRNPDAPMNLDVIWLSEGNETIAVRPVDLSNKLTEAFELPLKDHPRPFELRLAGSVDLHVPLEDVSGNLVNTLVQPCRK